MSDIENTSRDPRRLANFLSGPNIDLLRYLKVWRQVGDLSEASKIRIHNLRRLGYLERVVVNGRPHYRQSLNFKIALSALYYELGGNDDARVSSDDSIRGFVRLDYYGDGPHD